ncbi:MAG TPA: hypothetical protein VLS48_00480, partial [Anaerolineales bacterium]|nr:hypothetical protein [Anaerolineales bacterium]
MHKFRWLSYCLIVLSALHLAGPTVAQQAAPTGASDEEAESFLELVGHVGGPANGVAVQGAFAYIGLGPEFAVLDISDPQQPQRVGYSLLYDDVHDIAVSGSYAYVAGSGLYIVDIRAPEEPTITGSLPYSAPIHRLKLQDQTALLMGKDFLQLVDIHLPNQPRPLGVLYSTAEQTFVDLAITDTMAWISWNRCDRAGCLSGIDAVDLTDPQQPVMRASFIVTDHEATKLTVYNDYAFLQAGGLFVVDIDNPDQINLVGACSDCTSGNVYETTDRVYLIGEQVVDITSPEAPQALAACEFCQGDGIVTEGYAYFASGFYGLDSGGVGLQIVDLQAMPDPQLAGAYHTFAAEGLTIVGKRAYLIQAGKLGIVDLSSPDNPQVASFFLPLRGATAIEVSANYAYVSGLEGLAVINVANPYAPYQAAFFPTPGAGAQDLEVDVTLAYLADLENGVSIFDLASPHSPQLLAQIPLPTLAEGLAFRRD